MSKIQAHNEQVHRIIAVQAVKERLAKMKMFKQKK